MVILLQEKNFGPNVIYNVFVTRLRPEISLHFVQSIIMRLCVYYLKTIKAALRST